MPIIERVHAREVFDSRGKPTVEVEITCQGARPGRAMVPSGASTGRFEAIELRDGEERLDGLGVQNAVANVNSVIANELVTRDAADQPGIDELLGRMDGTDNKSRLGANACLGVSLAAAYASAEALRLMPWERFRDVWREACSAADVDHLVREPAMPLPMVNMISGGLHAGGHLDFQDYLILPVGATSYREAFDWIVSVYRKLSPILKSAGFEGDLVGDEGGYGPRLESNEQALTLVMQAIEAAGLRGGDDVMIGLDVASSHFFRDGTYHLSDSPDRPLSSREMVERLVDFCDRYPIVSIEDGLDEDDWQGWKLLTERLGSRVQLIGDDLFVTNVGRLQRGIESSVANSILIKPNQIGTLTETMQAMRMALEHGYSPVVSARSGETEDTMIADLVVGTGAGQLKVGSVARSERLAKYNQLLRIEEQLGPDAAFAGRSVLGRSG